MDRYRSYALPGVAALVLALYYLFGPSPDDTSDASTAAEATSNPGRAGRPGKSDRAARRGSNTGARATAAQPQPPRPAPSAAAPTQAPPVDPAARRAAADAMRERVAAALQPTDAPALDKDYIQARIREDLLPIATECYESALEDDPTLGGRLVLQFSIVGSDDVGGIVDEVTLTPQSDIKQPDLVECMTESMMSVMFEAPPSDGTVRVTYPFVFATEPEASQ